MLRTLLVGILAVTAAAACSSKGDAPAAQPGVAAGKVVELTGTVTATRGTEVRTLTAGGEISSDDVIDTAANSRVVILVAHNNARWDLGPNKHGKVGESLAWTAAKQDRPATAVIEESSTAGAHAEKTAATTGTTTDEEAPKAAMAEAARAPSADKAAAAPPADDFQAKGPADPAPAPSSAQPSAPPPPPARVETERRREQAPPKRGPTTDKKVSEAMPVEERKAPLKSSKQLGIRGGEAPGGGVMGAMTSDEPEGGGDGTRTPLSPPGPVREIQLAIREQFAKLRTQMRACIESGVDDVEIDIAVIQGVYSISSPDLAVTKKARACLASIAKRMGSTTKHAKLVQVRLTLAKP